MEEKATKMTVSQRKWHIGREIPVAILIMFFIQTVTLVWYFSAYMTRTDMRIAQLEKNTDGAAWQAEKIIRIDEKISTLQSSMQEIKTALQSASTTIIQTPSAKR